MVGNAHPTIGWNFMLGEDGLKLIGPLDCPVAGFGR
jgi:hypothetical protein